METRDESICSGCHGSGEGGSYHVPGTESEFVDGPCSRCGGSGDAKGVAGGQLKVYLVATGEVHEGEETYTRHEGAPPPLCDAECLYTRPPVKADDSVEQESRALRAAVKSFTQLLAGNEWAEHISSDPDAQALESEITRVIGQLEALRQQVKGLGPATDAQVETLRGLDTATRVRFYEHDFYVLSNFSAFNLEWKGITFPTSEHAYHWEKFNRGGGGATIQRDIVKAPSAHEAFKEAERMKTFRRTDWDDVKVGIMLDILRAKAQQHEYVRRKLLDTGDRQLVEDSWRDDFWGWGPDRQGQNMLGRLWMQVRAELRAGEPAGAASDAVPEVVQPVRAQPRLAVRLTSFPESNGKRNWTALLVRADAWDGLVGNCGGVSLAHGEMWNRVAYHAECAKLLIGERDTEPHILDYGDDIATPEGWPGEVHGGRKVGTGARRASAGFNGDQR